MQEEKLIAGKTEEEVWQQLQADLERDPELLNYRTLIEQAGHRILLDIDIDLGGGFEGGYATTTLMASLQTSTPFKFSIHKEGVLDEAGKLFGMQDVVLGDPVLDDKLII